MRMTNTKDFWLDKARHYLQSAPATEDLESGIAFENYVQLGSLLYSIIHISQKSLFFREEKLEEEVRTDIYNLLDIAKKLIPRSELEFLDEIRKEIA